MIRDAKELHKLHIDDLTEEEVLSLDQFEFNWCDKCKCVEHTYNLTWICEDFQPKKGEKLSEEFYKKWGDNALCLECYKKEIKQVSILEKIKNWFSKKEGISGRSNKGYK